MRNHLGLATAALCLLTVAALADERAAIKPGLWEFTHQTDANGRPPIPEDLLAKMPPETRARMDAAMQARAAGSGGSHGGSSTTRQCMTEKDLERGFRADDDRQHCTQKVLSRTRTSMEVAVECTNVGGAGGSGHGTFKWSAPNSETVAGTIDMTLTQSGQSMTTKVKLSGRWLGADCGDVKPRPQD